MPGRLPIYTSALMLVLASASARAETPMFDMHHVVTETVLASTVTNSSVQFLNSSAFLHEGTLISGDAFQGAVGIIAVLQNTGINSVVQQAVSFNADSITLD